MQNTDFERRRFTADPEEINKISSQKTKQILGIVLGVVLLILSFFFAGLQEQNKFDRSKNDIYGIVKVGCIGVGLLEVILSPIILYKLSKTENLLAQTYIVLDGDTVEGLHFINPDSDSSGQHFSISYDDITQAELISDPVAAKGNNISIRAKSGTYYCYAIEQKAIVVNLINERKAKYDERAMFAAPYAQPYVQQIPIPSNAAPAQQVYNNNVCYCMYCGTELPNGALFCYKCGRNQQQ